MPDGPGRRQGRPRWRAVLRSLDPTLGPPGHPRPASGPAGVPSMNRKARPRKRLPRARGQTAPDPASTPTPGRRASAQVCERHRVRSDVDVQPRRRRSPGPRSRSCRAFAPPPPSPSRAGPGTRPGPCGPFPMRGPRLRDGPSNQAEGGCGRRTSPHGVKAPVPREGANAVPARGCLEAGRVVWHPHGVDCGGGR